jgi:type I restriction enzyme, S subunit
MEKVKINNICNISNGYAFKSDRYVNEDGARVIRITNVQKGQIVDNDPKLYPFSELDKLDAYKIYEGDILMSLTGNVGRVGRYPKELLPAYINQRVCRVMPKSEKLDSNFLFHFLNSDVFEKEAIKNSAGAAQLNLSTKWLGDFEIPLPPLATQQKIAAILDQASAIIVNNRAILEKYDALTQSLFLDMFGDPMHNPKKWQEVKFSEVGKLDRGKSKHRPRNAPELLNGPYPLVQTGDVANSNGYITSYKSTYSEFGLSQSKLWPKGTLCITIAANIANTGILTFDACFPDSVVGFVPNDETNNIYVQNWMSFLQEMIEEKAPMAAQKNINLAILKDLNFMKPPVLLQNQFAERVQVIEAQKQQAQLELAKSEELFNSLLQKAFKGELN